MSLFEYQRIQGGQIDRPASQIPPDRMLRAKGNLTYLQFIRLVDKLWTDTIGVRSDGVTPRVPMRAEYTALSDPDYPVILYSLQLRRPFQNEPKMKYREVYNTEGNATIVRAQKFENIVQFSVMDRVHPSGAERTEEIIEVFEDFMIECTPVFKELGLSDFFYARRTADTDSSRPGTDVVRRSINYQVITEKIVTTEVWRLEEIAISARQFVFDNQRQDATPNTHPPWDVTISLDDQLSG